MLTAPDSFIRNPARKKEKRICCIRVLGVLGALGGSTRPARPQTHGPASGCGRSQFSD